MASSVLAFRGRADRTPSVGEDEAWAAWFRSLGSRMVDSGRRVGQVRTLDGAGADPEGVQLTGYVVITADDLDAAAELAAGCPGLSSGVRVEVGKAADA